MMSNSWFVYCLATAEEPVRTYIGATVDVDRRLQQHNGQRSGGAKATRARPGEWYRVCYVSGFKDNHDALSFEWHWKHASHKMQGDPLTRRQKALEKLLQTRPDLAVNG
jgi:structure-specific endonuclease subunit SLX1